MQQEQNRCNKNKTIILKKKEGKQDKLAIEKVDIKKETIKIKFDYYFVILNKMTISLYFRDSFCQ